MGRWFFFMGCFVLSALPTNVRAETAATPELSAELSEMVESGNVEKLDQLAGRCRSMLLEQAGELDLRVKFYFGQAQLDEVERFEKLLKRCSTSLEFLEESVERLEAFMEWYPVGQWDERFGRNGFYRQVMRLRRQGAVLRAVYHYYVAAIGMSAKRNVKEVVNELHQATQLLDEAEDVAEAELRLWKLKVQLLLAQLESEPLERIEPMMGALLKQPLNDEQLWSLRLAVLEHTHLLANGNAGKVKQQIQKTRKWLEVNQEVAEWVAQKQLELSLYEGTLERQRLLPRETSRDGDKINIVLDRQLAPLKQLARDDPKLRRAIELLIAPQIKPFFSGQKTDGFMRNMRQWDAFELMSLKRYYQAQKPADLDGILAVCDTFLATVSPDDGAYPDMLYQKGLTHYQKMGKTVEEKVRACQTWLRLAKEYPNWSRSSEVSAERAGALAGNMAYNLFVADPNAHGDLAKQVLGTLAKSRNVKGYRYYYGLVLMVHQQYRAAAQMLQSVGREDEHYGQACFQAAQCAMRLYPPEMHREQLVRALTEMIETIDPEGDDRKVLEVVLMLSRLHLSGTEADSKVALDLLDAFDAYWKALAKNEAIYRSVIFVRVMALKKQGRIKQALEELRPALQANPAESKLRDVALKLMQEFRGPLLAQHAQDRYDILIPSLEVVLPVSALLYGRAGKGFDQERIVLVGRLYLEQLTLWLLGPSNEKAKTVARLQKAKEVVGKLEKRAGIHQRLWFVRCRALLAYAQGDFEPSQLRWYRIRQSSSPQGQGRDTWWEARYFGLMCLYQQEGPAAVAGLVEQVLDRYAGLESEWINRLEQFKEGLRVKKEGDRLPSSRVKRSGIEKYGKGNVFGWLLFLHSLRSVEMTV